MFQISGRQFSLINYDQTHNQTNRAIKFIKIPIDFVNRVYIAQVEEKIVKGTNKNDIHHYEDNPTNNAIFRKDYQK